MTSNYHKWCFHLSFVVMTFTFSREWDAIILLHSLAFLIFLVFIFDEGVPKFCFYHIALDRDLSTVTNDFPSHTSLSMERSYSEHFCKKKKLLLVLSQLLFKTFFKNCGHCNPDIYYFRFQLSKDCFHYNSDHFMLHITDTSIWTNWKHVQVFKCFVS